MLARIYFSDLFFWFPSLFFLVLLIVVMVLFLKDNYGNFVFLVMNSECARAIAIRWFLFALTLVVLQ